MSHSKDVLFDPYHNSAGNCPICAEHKRMRDEHQAVVANEGTDREIAGHLWCDTCHALRHAPQPRES